MNEILLNNIDADIVPCPELPEPGRIYSLANDSNFVSAFFSKALTDFAGGFSDPEGLFSLLEFIAPGVPVDSQRFEYKTYNSNDSLKSDDVDDVRQVGADFKTVPQGGTNELGTALNKGLTVRLDLDSFGNNPKIKERVTALLLSRLWRNDIRRGITLLTANATNTAKTWDTTVLKDPDADVLEEIEISANAAGLPINRVLFGGSAWKRRYFCNSDKSTASAIAGRLMSPEQLAMILGVNEVRVSRERYSTGAAATSQTEIVGSCVYLFNARQNATTQDASNIKRFVVLLDNDLSYRVYEHRVSSNLLDLTVEHYSNVVITSATGIRKLTIS